MYTVEKLQSALDALKAKRSQLTGEGPYLQHCWLVQVKPGGNARTDRKYWQVRSRQPMFDGKTLKHLKLDEVEDYRAAIARGRQLKQIDREIQKLQQRLEQLIAKTDKERQKAEARRQKERGSVQFPISLLATDKNLLVQAPYEQSSQALVQPESESPTEPNILPSASCPSGVLPTRDAGSEAQHPLPSRQSKVRFTDAAEQERLVKEVLAKSQNLRDSLQNSATLSKLLRAGSVELRKGHPRVH
jgi:hypothetical protein